MEPNTFLMAADTANQNEWLWGLWTLPVFLLAIFLAIFWVAAVVSIIRSSYHWSMKVLAALGTFTAPFIGPLIWFLFGKRHDD